MDDGTLIDQPGVELDAILAHRILEEGDRYSRQTADMACFIQERKEQFRQHLLAANLIQQSNLPAQGFDLAAVDGASAVTAHGGGALVAAVAYKATINDPAQRGVPRVISLPNHTDLAAFATTLRVHLELTLLTADKLDEDKLVILDHSFWGVMQAISRALAAYKSRRVKVLAAERNPDTDAMLREWRALFAECLGATGSFLRMIRNKQVISLAKTGISQYFVQLFLAADSALDDEQYALGTMLNDRALLRHVLRPGEYTTPQTLLTIEQDTMQGRRRSRFATTFDPNKDGLDPFVSREAVLDEYGIPRDDGAQMIGRRVFLTYYWPYEWSRTYRIEFHEAMLARQGAWSERDLTGHGERFQKVLASLKQSLNPEAKEPLAQVLADERAKGGAATALTVLPERSFYQLREQYRNQQEMLDVIDTLLAEERT